MSGKRILKYSQRFWKVFRKKILKVLYWEHPGICAMKAIARTCVWWHKMDDEFREQ